MLLAVCLGFSAVCCLLRLHTRRHAFSYVFSPLITLSCAAATLSCAAATLACGRFNTACAALITAALGDYFMTHKGNRTLWYALGIGGFFISHLLFVLHALSVRTLSFEVGIIACALLLLGFVPYMIRRILPKAPRMLRIPLTMYMLVSVLGLSCALMTGSILYGLGIATLVFSDLMIAEHDFAGVSSAAKWILPTYYLSQMLAAAGIVLKF